MNGLLCRNSVSEHFTVLKKNGKRIVFTNGCFDILHIGHARYLAAARALGDILVVAVNSDASVQRLKGPDRPVNCEQDRAEMLLALQSVDYVVIFEEDTPYNVISDILPDVLVKGGDWPEASIVGADIVKQHGGVVRSLPFIEGRSTTTIIKKIQKKENS